jgi:membrane-associated protease RseP (regulator of RpoE activity)
LTTILGVRVVRGRTRISRNQGTAIGKARLLKPVTPREWLVHGFLFLLTCTTTTLAGVQWLNGNPLELSSFTNGLPYSALTMLFLTSHELGHYVAAKREGISATLPFFLPFPSFIGLFPFGTLGAVIRLREAVTSRRVLLSIGAAGPISGFIMSTIVLVVGFATLPGKGYLYAIHPEYLHLQSIPEGGLQFGSSVAYRLLEAAIPAKQAFVPPMNEIYHYPFLCVGWFGLFVTSLNLIPIGQLDGGHIASAVLGNRSKKYLHVLTITGLFLLGLLGLAPLVDATYKCGWPGWLLWAAILLLLSRRDRKVSSTDAVTELRSPHSVTTAVICLIIFLLTFVPAPISL